MILRDKEEVRDNMREIVDRFYYDVGTYNHMSGEDQIGEHVRRMVAQALQIHLCQAVKQMGHLLVDALVDGIYDASDFEKDVGLK